MQMFAAGIAGIGGTGLDSVELPFALTDRALRMVPIRRITLSPKPVQARGIVWVLAPELDYGQLRVGGLSPFRIVSVVSCHLFLLVRRNLLFQRCDRVKLKVPAGRA